MKKFALYVLILMAFKGNFMSANKNIFETSSQEKSIIVKNYNEGIKKENEYFNLLIKFIINGIHQYIDFGIIDSHEQQTSEPTAFFHLEKGTDKEKTTRLIIVKNIIKQLTVDTNKDGKKNAIEAKEKIFNLINIWCNAKVIEYLILKKQFPITLSSLNGTGATKILEFIKQVENYNVTTSLSDKNFFPDNYTGFIKYDDGASIDDFNKSTLKQVFNQLAIDKIGDMTLDAFFTNIFSLTSNNGEWNGNTEKIIFAEPSNSDESEVVKKGLEAILDDINWFTTQNDIKFDKNMNMSRYYMNSISGSIDATKTITPQADKPKIDELKRGKYIEIAAAQKIHESQIPTVSPQLKPKDMALLTGKLDEANIKILIDDHNQNKNTSSSGAPSSNEILTTQAELERQAKEFQKTIEPSEISKYTGDFDGGFKIPTFIGSHNTIIDGLESSGTINDTEAQKRKLMTFAENATKITDAVTKAKDEKELEWYKNTEANQIHLITEKYTASELEIFLKAHNLKVKGDNSRILKIEGTNFSGATIDEIATEIAKLNGTNLAELVDKYNGIKLGDASLSLHVGPFQGDETTSLRYVNGLNEAQLKDWVGKHNSDTTITNNGNLQLHVGEIAAPEPAVEPVAAPVAEQTMPPTPEIKDVDETGCLGYLEKIDKNQLVSLSTKYNRITKVKKDPQLQLNVGKPAAAPVPKKDEGLILKESAKLEVGLTAATGAILIDRVAKKFISKTEVNSKEKDYENKKASMGDNPSDKKTSKTII